MDEDEAPGGMNHSGAEDIARMGHGFIDGAMRDLFLTDKTEACINEEDADGFVGQVAHFRANELIDEFRGTERLFNERFALSTAADFEGGRKECRLGGAKGFLDAQELGGKAGELGKAAVGLKKALGDLDGVLSGNTGIDEECEQFRVGEGGGAQSEEALTRAVVPGQVRDAIG